MLIGQKKLLEEIDTLIDNGKFSRSVILCGKEGSQFFEITDYVGNRLGLNIVRLDDSRMDSIQQMFDVIYENTEPTLYVIPELDDAQFRVKHKLLKVLEEQPNRAYFMVTCTNLENLYAPIRSRCHILFMNNYSPDELVQYAADHIVEDSFNDVIRQLCETPGDVDKLLEYNIDEFDADIDKVIANIRRVKLSNAFKVGKSISFKSTTKGYDLSLFFRAINNKLIAGDLTKDNLRMIQITCKYLTELSYPTVNKQMIFDMWLLELRGM